MNVITKSTARDMAQMSAGSYSTGKGQIFEDFLWDTEAVPATFSNNLMQFFKRGIGSTFVAGTKTLVETCMDDNGKLPAGQSFLIKAIELHLVDQSAVTYAGVVDENASSIAGAWKLLLQNSVWEIKFSNNEYAWRSNGCLFMPSIMLQDNTAGSRLGDFNHYSWMKIGTEITVSEQVSFSLNATFQSGDPTLLARLNAAATWLNTNKVCIRPQLKGTLTRTL